MATTPKYSFLLLLLLYRRLKRLNCCHTWRTAQWSMTPFTSLSLQRSRLAAEVTGHSCRDEKVHFWIGGGVQFQRVKTDVMQSFVVHEERFVAVSDQATQTQHRVVRFHDHLRHLTCTPHSRIKIRSHRMRCFVVSCGAVLGVKQP